MIDWPQVEQLCQDMGDALDEILSVFQAEVAEALDRLDSAQDASEIADTAHFLKGAALNLGMSDLAALCALAETGARSGNVQACDPARIRALFVDSQRALVEGLALRAA